jgi:hypothetical protein
MTEDPDPIQVEDLMGSARVPVTEQSVEVPERRCYGSDSGGGPLLGDGVPPADADGRGVGTSAAPGGRRRRRSAACSTPGRP